MALTVEHITAIEKFFQQSDFSNSGAVITDLDGTAVHEFDNMIVIHKEVGAGLRKIYDLGRPVVINTLRFPLSVIKTFAKEWYDLARNPIPVVLLNGSQLGYIKKVDGAFVFDQLHAFPLHEVEVGEVVNGIARMMNDGIRDINLFFYPEDWTLGEMIWTPQPESIIPLKEKYKSASSVISTGVDELKTILTAQPICMMLLLVQAKDDDLMAYQHTRQSNFITHHKVDKLSGTIEMAKVLGFNLPDSIGAGDSGMDVFLSKVGLAIHVRTRDLPYKGTTLTLPLDDYQDYGSVLSLISSMHKQHLIMQ